MKTCNKCGFEKKLNEFYDRPGAKDGKRADCIKCLRKQQKAHRAKNAEALSARQRAYAAANPDIIRNQRLKKYALTLDDYDRMLEEQLGLCANPGCFNEPTADKRFHVDHDHFCCDGKRSCGKCVRGLLCRACNLALGYVQDDIKRLQGLIDYLRSN